jgi:hypothetical protein
MEKMAGEGPSQRCRGGATKPSTSWQAAAEAAEQARVLRVWRVEVELTGVDLGLGFGVVVR